jgi:DNA mismatch repair protein MutS2
MTVAVGDSVHVAALGKGIVREIRRGGRYLVELKGRAIVVDGGQLTPVEPAKKARAAKAAAGESPRRVARGSGANPSRAVFGHGAASPSIDLHGMTVHEALDALASFLNRALLDDAAEARIVHGRGGGRIRAAVHERLKGMPSIRGFGLEPGNPGVTIVQL